jgi:hypothetical protein
MEQTEMDLIDQAVWECHRRQKLKEEMKRHEESEKLRPTVCFNDGGCDWGLAFSQD